MLAYGSISPIAWIVMWRIGRPDHQRDPRKKSRARLFGLPVLKSWRAIQPAFAAQRIGDLAASRSGRRPFGRLGIRDEHDVRAPKRGETHAGPR